MNAGTPLQTWLLRSRFARLQMLHWFFSAGDKQSLSRRHLLQLSDLQYLMYQLGPSMPEISAIVQEKDECWHVEFDDAVRIQINWQAHPPAVMATCMVGEVDDEWDEPSYARLLNANRLLVSSANTTLALSPSGERVELIGECMLASGSLSELQRELSRFIRLAAGVAVMISELPDEVWKAQKAFPLELQAHRP